MGWLWFKFACLEQYVRELHYDYFIWLDADTYFVRNPGDVLSVLQGSPVHSSLESDACSPLKQRPDWWGCPLRTYAQLMKQLGVTSERIFNVNAGLWIVQRDVIEMFYSLAVAFWETSAAAGYEFTEEAPLAYATHMLCGNPDLHTLRTNPALWGSDWIGSYADKLPDGSPWTFEDYFTGERFEINPAIVHAMRSKDALIRTGSASKPD